jgi:TDG/mug DNA glycosylase family protein
MAEHRNRPSPELLAAAVGRTVPDVIGPGLAVLFCGINPGLWSGAVGHHFAHPGNRFWKAIAAAGFTDEVLRPEDESRLRESGVGITNVVAVTTRTAKELTRQQLQAGALALETKVKRYRPRAIVFLGIAAYREGF